MDEQRHCVTCGELLTNENAHGLICLECFNKDRPAYMEKRHPKLVEVGFCRVCGKTLTPVGNEIAHSLCL